MKQLSVDVVTISMWHFNKRKIFFLLNIFETMSVALTYHIWSSKPDSSIMCPIDPRKLMIVWNTPILRMMAETGSFNWTSFIVFVASSREDTTALIFLSLRTLYKYNIFLPGGK